MPCADIGPPGVYVLHTRARIPGESVRTYTTAGIYRV